MSIVLIAIMLIGALHADPIVIPSQKSFYTTYKKLIRAIRSRKLKIFCIIDHAKNAKKIAQKLPPTKLILFGNPQMGTKLMQKEPTIALELPLHIAIFQKEEKTYIAYKDPKELSHYAVPTTIIHKIENLYKSLIDEATH